MEDIAVKEVKARVAEAERAIQRAWDALDGVEDKRERAELEFQIINLGARKET